MKDTIVQGLAQAYQNLVHMLADFVPRFIIMVTIILVGLAVAVALKKILRYILHFTKLDRISEEAGASHVLRRAAMPSMSEFLSRSLFWITLLGFVLLGISVLQIAELQEQISRLFQLLPQIFVAIVILFIGILTANFLSGRSADRGKRRLSFARPVERIRPVRNLDTHHIDGSRTGGACPVHCRGGVLDRVRRGDARSGDCLRPWRT